LTAEGPPTIMAHPHVHGIASDDSDASAFSLRASYDGDKHDVPLSPTTSELPELLKETVSLPDHEKQSSRRKEETPDGRPYPPVIPPNHGHGRTLVLCFDGTGDQFDADNSNIVQLVSLLKKDDKSRQLVYYQVLFSSKINFLLFVRLT
jgi:hypothetical protein